MDYINFFTLTNLWRQLRDGDEDREYRCLQINRRLNRDLHNPLEWPDALFARTYRLNKDVFITLRDELSNLRGLQYATKRRIPLDKQIFVTLEFYATGSYQRITGSANNMAQQTVSKCIRQVTELMNTPEFIAKWIQFPRTRACRDELKQGFYEKFDFPGVIGAVDGTHVALIRPDQYEAQFYNRKGYHSLNVLIVCDSYLKILAVNSKFGGAAHDSHVWQMSGIRLHVEDLSNAGEEVWLLGDSGYAQRPWMMTPINNAREGSPEARFNTVHATARNSVERCIGVLKNRWRCLLKHRVLHYEPIVCSKIVNACCILHNMLSQDLLQERLPEREDVDQLPPIPPPIENGFLFQGRAVRHRIMQRFI